MARGTERDRWVAALALAAMLLVPGTLVAQGGTDRAADGPGAVQALLETGHRGGVSAMEYDPARSMLFTAGSDGVLRIWSTTSRRLVGEIGLGILPPLAVAVNPVGTQVAVLQGDATGSFAASVWDWERGQMLGRAALDAEPLFMRWSSGGSWLMLGEPTWQSLRLLAPDGSDVPFKPEGFGIVGFAEVSRTERTLMTYLTGGRLLYWDIATGAVQQELRTAPRLAGIRISADRRYAAGSDGTDVVVIDLVTGAVRSRMGLPGVQDLDLSAAGDQVACVAAGAVSRWSLAQGTPARIPDPSLPEGATGVRFAADAAFVAGASGSLYGFDGGAWRPVARSVLASPTGIAALDSALAVASPGWLWIFRGSGLLSGAAEVPAPLVVRNPLGSPTGLSRLDAGLLAWRQQAGGSGALLIDPSTGATVRELDGLRGPLVEVDQLPADPAAPRLLTVDQSGTIRVVDPADGRRLYEAWLPGTLRAASLGGSLLVAGRTPLGSGGPLLRVDTATGEQVAIASRGRVVYDLLEDPAAGFLYALGAADRSTALLRYRGTAVGDETMLQLLDVEDLGAGLALDRSGTLYCSLGASDVGVWTADGRQGTLPGSGRAPRKVVAGGGLVAAVNQDGTVSIWNGATMDGPARLSLLESGGWCLVMPDGRYAGSDDAVALLRVIRGGEALEDAAALRVPVR